MFKSLCLILDYANRTVCALYHIRAVLLRELVLHVGRRREGVTVAAGSEKRVRSVTGKSLVVFCQLPTGMR
jgi:hypothetical protein